MRRGREKLTASGGFFVGRGWELAQLSAALDAARGGRGQLFVVSGEAGIGKSRLMRELADLATGQAVQVMWGRCWEGEEAPTLWPWIQIFRRLMTGGQVPSDLGPDLRRFFDPIAEAASQPPSDHARFRLFDAAATLIRTAAASQPLVLILEDLHEADRTSLLLLEFLALHLHDLALLVVATYRDPEADLRPALADALGRIVRRGHLIHVPGLRTDEISEFLDRGFGITLSGEGLSAVREGTGGNPLFLDELARRFAAEQQLRTVAGGGLEVPQGLKAPIRARLATLSPGDRNLLELASVIGREFSFELLLQTSGLPRADALGTIGRLSALRLVDPAGFGLGPYRFTHALVRETVYQDLLPAERSDLHRRVGHAIEARHTADLDGHLDQLAHHFSQAAVLGEVDRAIAYSQRAGQRATRQFGFDEAIDHFQRAIDLTRGSPGSGAAFDLALALGDAQWWAGRSVEAGETFRSAALLAREMGDAHRLADAALRVGEVGYGGVFMQAWSFDPLRVQLLEEALAALGNEESVLTVRVLARLSTALYFSPYESSSRREALSAAAVDHARRLGDIQTVAYAVNARHLAVWGPDNLEERRALAAETIDLARQVGDVRLELTGRVWHLTDLLESGDVAGADDEIGAFEALAQQLAYPHFVAYSFMFRALQAALRGEFEAAEANALRSGALGEQIGDVNLALSHNVQMTALRAFQGRLPDTVAYIELIEPEHPPGVGAAIGQFFRLIAGNRTEVAATFPSIWRVRERIPPAFSVAYAAGVATLAASIGAEEEATFLYDLLRGYEGRWVLAGRDGVACVWPIAYVLGVTAASLSRFESAAGHFDTAIRAAEEAGAYPTMAMAQLAYGAMLARRGGASDGPRAALLLRAARKTAGELGMPQVADEAATALAGLPKERAMEQPVGQPPPDGAVFRNEGEYWTIGFDHVVVRMKDAKGFRYLRTLLGEPGREFHVLDLAGGAPIATVRAGGHKVLDSKAKAAYRSRIDDLREDVEDAEACNDPERASRARQEMDFIVDELARSVGLGGRDRETTSAGERARSAVSKSLRTCMQRIDKAHPALGAHLATTVRTGYFCSYRPDPRAPVDWRT